jgi:hypothetical protein
MPEANDFKGPRVARRDQTISRFAQGWGHGGIGTDAEHFPSPSTAINSFVKYEPVHSRTSPSELPGSENSGRQLED